MAQVKYSSRTFFTYEVDYPFTLAPGSSVELPFNVHGDSDFFWQKFAAFGLASGAATTVSAEQLPALSMSIVNQTTGRAYSQKSIALPNLSGYGQFLPMMPVWPRKSSVLVTLENEDPATTVTVHSGFASDAAGIGTSGEDVTFVGYNSPFVPGAEGPVGTVSPSSVNGESLLVAGVFSGFGFNIFYVVLAAGAANFFSQVTAQLGAGPVNTYLSSGAVFLASGNSGTIEGIPVTATGGSTWFWNDVGNNDFASGQNTTLVFSFGSPPLPYSLLQLSFMGAKAFPKL